MDEELILLISIAGVGGGVLLGVGSGLTWGIRSRSVRKSIVGVLGGGLVGFVAGATGAGAVVERGSEFKPKKSRQVDMNWSM